MSLIGPRPLPTGPQAHRHLAPSATSSALRLMTGVGRTMVGAGVLVLAFAGFQLWGTGLAETRAQEELTARFRAEQRTAATEPAPHDTAHHTALRTAPDDVPARLASVADGADARFEDGADLAAPIDEQLRTLDLLRRRLPAPEPGDPIAVLDIPAIGVTKTVVEGTTRDALRSGPGHYRATPLPGRPGNTAIAGHRTTHGAPFFDIDQLKPGDEIRVETATGDYTYLVDGFDDGTGTEVGHRIVDPGEVGVIADQGDDRLTLTACHPKYSAKQRIVVTASLIPVPEPEVAEVAPPPPAPAATGAPTAPPTTAQPSASAEPVESVPLPSEAEDGIARSLGWQTRYAGVTLAWAAFTGFIALAGWVVGRLWRRVPAYAMAVPPFGLSLFYCFVNLERFLPAV